MKHFISGMLMMGYSIASLFFFRFWRDSRDRLFIFFGTAFALLAFHRVTLAAADHLPFAESTYYMLRVVAYVMILIAIVDRNRR
jgi:hypothetical protein